MFNLFKKHCPICGMDVDKEKAIKRFGAYLCSEGHAEEYRKKLAAEESKAASRGRKGCC